MRFAWKGKGIQSFISSSQKLFQSCDIDIMITDLLTQTVSYYSMKTTPSRCIRLTPTRSVNLSLLQCVLFFVELIERELIIIPTVQKQMKHCLFLASNQIVVGKYTPFGQATLRERYVGRIQKTSAFSYMCKKRVCDARRRDNRHNQIAYSLETPCCLSM